MIDPRDRIDAMPPGPIIPPYRPGQSRRTNLRAAAAAVLTTTALFAAGVALLVEPAPVYAATWIWADAAVTVPLA